MIVSLKIQLLRKSLNLATDDKDGGHPWLPVGKPLQGLHSWPWSTLTLRMRPSGVAWAPRGLVHTPCVWGGVVHGVWGRPSSGSLHPSSGIVGSLLSLWLSLILWLVESWVCCCSLAALGLEEELSLHSAFQAGQWPPSGFLKRIPLPLINFWHAALGSSCVSKSS